MHVVRAFATLLHEQHMPATATASYPDFSHLPRLQHGAGEEHSFVAAFRRLLLALGRVPPYWYLMAVSGAAFRLQIHCNGWRMNSTDVMCGFDLTGHLCRAFGVQAERVWVCGEEQRMRALRTRILDNLQRGWPTIGLGMDGRALHGLIIGAITNEHLVALDYSVRGHAQEVLQKMVWCYHLVTAVDPPRPEAEHIQQAFALAREVMTTPRAASFHLGLDAYDYWHATLVNPEHHNPLANDWRAHERNDGNYWLCCALVDARRSAATFCRWIAARQPAVAHLALALADQYTNVADAVQPLVDRQVVRPDAQISAARPWTMHDRRKQVLALDYAREREVRALALLQQLCTT
jgi:hypothetical protein